MNKILNEPFRLFFPLALLQLIVGVSIWIPQLYSPEYYPVQLHRALAINGYLYSMILGFLLTALPAFTKTKKTSRAELIFGLALSLAPTYAGLLAHPQFVSFLSIAQASFLFLFVLKRFMTMNESPPYSFIFLPVALLLWFSADLRFILTEDHDSLFILYEASTLAFIIAIGTRLIPGLLGHQEIVDYQRSIYERNLPFFKIIPKGYLLMAFVYALSAFSFETDLLFVRLGILTSIALSYWRIFSFPTMKTSYSWSVWLCVWGILIANFLRLFFPEYGIHISHGHFLIALVLLSLLVATRVVRAHVIKDNFIEKSRLIFLLVGLVFITAATRVTAPFLANSYESHLAYSSLILVFICLFWAYLIWSAKRKSK